MFKMFPGTYIKSLVKIRSVTAEIFLIWTNVVKTNVAWTNITDCIAQGKYYPFYEIFVVDDLTRAIINQKLRGNPRLPALSNPHSIFACHRGPVL